VSRDWRPVFYTEADVDELVALCQAQPGKAATITPEYVRWQHSANPAGLAQVGLARENGSGRIVGVVWLMPLHIQVNGEAALGSQSMYALVHSDYRRQGVFSALVTFCDEEGQRRGFNFSYGFPNPNSYPAFVRRLGWSDLGQARLFLRPLNVSRLIERRLGSGPFQSALAVAASTGERVLFQPRLLSPKAAQITVEDIDTTDSALNKFWARVWKKYPVMVVRDARFLDWRYKQIPDRHYQLWAARQDKQIIAITALRSVSIEGIACGMVVDLLAEPGERGRLGGELLLQRAAEHFQQQDLDLAGCLMLPHADEIGSLRHQGYLPCPRALQPQPFRVVVRVFEEGQHSAILLDLKNWFLTMGDFDAV
jgi:GNAT superfamily N-acetyltransferase